MNQAVTQWVRETFTLASNKEKEMQNHSPEHSSQAAHWPFLHEHFVRHGDSCVAHHVSQASGNFFFGVGSVAVY